MRILLATAVLLALGVSPAMDQMGIRQAPAMAHAGMHHAPAMAHAGMHHAPAMAPGGMRHNTVHGARVHRQLHRHLALRNEHFGQAAGFAPFFGDAFDTFGFDEPMPAPIDTGVALASPLPTLPRPPRHPGDDRATVETTPFGVTVIRGPGSRHIAQ